MTKKWIIVKVIKVCGHIKTVRVTVVTSHAVEYAFNNFVECRFFMTTEASCFGRIGSGGGGRDGSASGGGGGGNRATKYIVSH